MIHDILQECTLLREKLAFSVSATVLIRIGYVKISVLTVDG